MKCYFSEDGTAWRCGTIATTSNRVSIVARDDSGEISRQVVLHGVSYYFGGRSMAISGYEPAGADCYRLRSLEVVFHKAAVPKGD